MRLLGGLLPPLRHRALPEVVAIGKIVGRRRRLDLDVPANEQARSRKRSARLVEPSAVRAVAASIQWRLPSHRQ